MNKAYRHGQILKLISRYQIHTQEEIAQKLAALGVAATQVTLSRDIRELGLAKTQLGYQHLAPTSPSGPNLATVLAEYLLDIREAQHLLVLKTSPGHASTLAAALDRAAWPELVGTIAGDDTVLAIAPDLPTARKLKRKLLDPK
ncbi:MAG: ArgR family transcriptional regulator [Acidobacteria bacterium]|nr:ArgR family transcriptional regulator [Acidobacteriota bacterium]